LAEMQATQMEMVRPRSCGWMSSFGYFITALGLECEKE